MQSLSSARRVRSSSSARLSAAAIGAAVVAGLVLPAPLASASPVRSGDGAATASRTTAWERVPVHNGGFQRGDDGWRATGAEDFLRATNDGMYGGGIELRTRRQSTAALNDQQNVVSSTRQGREYRATVWVRTATPSVDAQLRLREVSNGVQVDSTTESVTLRDRRWHQLTIDHTTVAAGSTTA